MGPDSRTEFYASDDRAFLWRVRTIGTRTFVDRWTADGWHPSPDGGAWLLRMAAIGSPDDRSAISAANAIRLAATLS